MPLREISLHLSGDAVAISVRTDFASLTEKSTALSQTIT